MDFHIRPPAAAGTFYPDDKEDLTKFLDEYVHYKNSGQCLKTRALIVPHAGYRYSGKTAAKAFSLIEPGSFSRAIIIGPSHCVDFHGASISPYKKYLTPLGLVNIDSEAIHNLTRQCDLIGQREEVHNDEHAIEVELPFIQKLAPSCQIIPIIIGRLDDDEILKIGRILGNWWDKDTLVIISSDFIHYGSRFHYCPFPVADAPIKIKELDIEAVKLIKNKNTEQFRDFIHRTNATICGNIPISILLSMIEKFEFETEFNLVDYTNSGKILNDYINSVSYAAMALNFDTSHLTKSKPIHLSLYDQTFLLNSAFCSIKSRLNNSYHQTPGKHHFILWRNSLYSFHCI